MKVHLIFILIAGSLGAPLGVGCQRPVGALAPGRVAAPVPEAQYFEKIMAEIESVKRADAKRIDDVVEQLVRGIDLDVTQSAWFSSRGLSLPDLPSPGDSAQRASYFNDLVIQIKRARVSDLRRLDDIREQLMRHITLDEGQTEWLRVQGVSASLAPLPRR